MPDNNHVNRYDKMVVLTYKPCGICRESMLHDEGYVIENNKQIAKVSICIKCHTRKEVNL
jgi:cytidine deaminase